MVFFLNNIFKSCSFFNYNYFFILKIYVLKFFCSGNTSFQEKGSISFGEALKVNTTLKYLYIGNFLILFFLKNFFENFLKKKIDENEIDKNMVNYICKGLAKNTSLEFLSLRFYFF